MTYERDDYMRRQEAEHDMIRMRSPGWTKAGHAWLDAGAPLPINAGELARLQRERDYAVRWANQSVEMLQEAFFPLADALRNLESYLRSTPHHNAPEAAAARKALAVFDTASVDERAERQDRGDGLGPQDASAVPSQTADAQPSVPTGQQS
jgi:hypothetical protein